MIPRLSKSKVQSGRQCHKRLWLETFQPQASRWDASAQLRLHEGTLFGEVARGLLGDGILVAADHLHVDEALAETAALLKSPRRQALLLFEPAFSHEGVRVRVDALRVGDEGDTLIEIKSTTSVKQEHLWDCAIQTWVARGSGRNIARILHGHVDTSFVYEKEGDYRGLLRLEDVTERVEALVPRVAGIVERLKAVVSGPMPLVSTGSHCSEPYACPFMAHCRMNEPDRPEFPLAVLPRANAVVAKLTDAGYRDLRDVPDVALSTAAQRRVASVTRSGMTFVSAALKDELAEIRYPRAYLDFETIAFIVPRWLGTRPFQQLPFQFSCHVECRDGTVRHHEFVDLSGDPPFTGFVSSLLAAVSGAEAIVVWNKGFEGARLRELAERFPRHAGDLLAVVDMMVDLLPLYRRHYYHRDMRGSWSIKAVLPTIAPDLAYGDLEVADGGGAQSAYVQACHPATSEHDRQRLRAQLLAYCARDTLAMLRLAHACDVAGVPAATDDPLPSTDRTETA